MPILPSLCGRSTLLVLALCVLPDAGCRERKSPGHTSPSPAAPDLADAPAAGADDSAFLQSGIDAAPPGGTFQFPPGNFRIGAPLQFHSGRIYRGSATILTRVASSGFIAHTDEEPKDLAIVGITFNGAGLKLEANAERVAIEGCTFENIDDPDPASGNGLFIPDGLSRSRIAGNKFIRILSGNGIILYNPEWSEVSGNLFDDNFEGIHALFFKHGQGVSVSRNVGTRISRHFIEIQDAAEGLIVADNRVSDWLPQRNADHDGHIALSIATGGSHGVKILRNVIIGSGFSDPDYHYTAIEAMGDDLLIEGNFASNWGWGELVGHSKQWTTAGNTFCGVGLVIVPEEGGAAPAVDRDNRIYPRPDAVAPPATLAPSTPAATTLPTTAP